MNENTTKEGIEVQIGQVWLDLDKRMGGRKRCVIAIEEGKAVMQAPGGQGRRTKVAISRMHNHNTGWSLVK